MPQRRRLGDGNDAGDFVQSSNRSSLSHMSLPQILEIKQEISNLTLEMLNAQHLCFLRQEAKMDSSISPQVKQALFTTEVIEAVYEKWSISKN
jgi:hypothetical protein